MNSNIYGMLTFIKFDNVCFIQQHRIKAIRGHINYPHNTLCCFKLVLKQQTYDLNPSTKNGNVSELILIRFGRAKLYTH